MVADHENIIGYRHVIRSNAKVFNIIMEYADGGDLLQRIQHSKDRGASFSEDDILIWFCQVCLAISHLHERGMLHRDIKTANLFLTKTGLVKLGDFGIARVLEKKHGNQRMSARTCRTPVGTPMYLAPELCKGRPYGQKADMWALGCVLHELCTLVPTFTASSMDSLLHRIKRGIYDKQIPPQYSSDLALLIKRLLTLDPTLRPSIGDVMKTPLLQPYFQRLSASSVARRQSSASVPSEPEANPAPAPSPSPRHMPPIGQLPVHGDPSLPRGPREPFLQQPDIDLSGSDGPKPAPKKRKLRKASPPPTRNPHRNLTPGAQRVSSPAPSPRGERSRSTPSTPVSVPKRAEILRRGYGANLPAPKSGLGELASWYKSNSPRPSPRSSPLTGRSRGQGRVPLSSLNGNSFHRHREKRHYRGSPLSNPRPSKLQRIDNNMRGAVGSNYSSAMSSNPRYSNRPPFSERPF